MAHLRTATAVLVTLWFAAPLSAHALNTAFLREAPIAFFSKDDLDLFRDTVMLTLVRNADGETAKWQSTTTDSNGEVTPLDTRSIDGTTCRRTRILNRAKGREGQGVYELCRQPNGEWKVVNRVGDR